MKKQWIIFIVVIMITAITLSCNLTQNLVALILDQDQQAISEKHEETKELQEEDLIDEMEEQEKQSELPISELEKLEWDSNIPKIFPKFNGGTLVISKYLEEDAVWSLGFYEVPFKKIEDYKDFLQRKDWEMVSEPGINVYEFIKEDKKITILVGAEENGSHFVTLYLEEQDGNQIHPNSELNYDNMNGGDIPETYPTDLIPIDVTDATIIDAEKVNAGGTQIFSIIYGTNSPIEEESAKIKSMLESVITTNNGELQDIMGMMYIGTTGNWDFNIAIGDGSADGFTTLVTYIVTEKQ